VRTLLAFASQDISGCQVSAIGFAKAKANMKKVVPARISFAQGLQVKGLQLDINDICTCFQRLQPPTDMQR
jgi:hypothetical protein